MLSYLKKLFASYRGIHDASPTSQGGQTEPVIDKDVVHIVYRPSTKPINLDDPFPWDERSSLVMYAAHGDDAAPDHSTPSIIVHNFDQFADRSLLPDGIPYFTVLDSQQILPELKTWAEKLRSTNIEQERIAFEVSEWAKQKIAEGWVWFLYATEPPEYAGNSYPWAIYAERNRSKS